MSADESPFMGAKKAARAVGDVGEWVTANVPGAMLWIVTFPYARFYRYNTSKPLWQMAKLKNDGNDIGLLEAIQQWRTYKTAELEFSFVASGLLTAAFIGAFSWQQIDQVYWMTGGFWSCGLVLAFLGVSLSAQERSILNYFGPRGRCPVHKAFQNTLSGYALGPRRQASHGLGAGTGAEGTPDGDQDAHQDPAASAVTRNGQLDPSSLEIINRHTDLLLTKDAFAETLQKIINASLGQRKKNSQAGGNNHDQLRPWRPKRKMLFFWQAPIMFMGYSVCAFLIGVTLYFVTPLIHGDEGPSRNTAIFYLIVAGLELVLYQVCSFWASVLARPPELAHETLGDIELDSLATI